jgi:hypothetical protein
MRDVYRRTDMALWTALMCLPIAIVSALVVALAGARWTTSGGLIGALFGLCTAMLLLYGAGFKRRGRDPDTRIAPAAAMRARLLRRHLIGLAVLVALVAVLDGADSLSWWYLPCVYGLMTLGATLGWAHLTRWERHHPGAISVTDFAAWRADSYIWLTDATATPVPPRTARGLTWLLGDR